MKCGKWNYNTRSYDDYELPEKAIMWSDDMELVIQCASCAKDIEVGDCFTSKEIHGNFGMGYLVCESCYEQEIERNTKKGKKC